MAASFTTNLAKLQRELLDNYVTVVNEYVKDVENKHNLYLQLLELVQQMPEIKQLREENAELKRGIVPAQYMKDFLTMCPHAQAILKAKACPVQLPTQVPTQVPAEIPAQVSAQVPAEIPVQVPAELVPTTVEAISLQIIEEPIATPVESDVQAKVDELYEQIEEPQEQEDQEQEDEEIQEEEIEVVDDTDDIPIIAGPTFPWEERKIEPEPEPEPEEDEQEPEAEDGEEVELVEIPGHGSFFASNTKNGIIYAVTEDEDVGDEVGRFVNGKPVFQ